MAGTAQRRFRTSYTEAAPPPMAAPMPAPFLPSMMPPTTAPDPAPAPMMIAVFFHERFGSACSAGSLTTAGWRWLAAPARS